MWFASILLLLAATFDESYRAGLQALAQNRLHDARLNLESAAQAEPANSRVWVALAQTYWKLRDSAKADEAAARAAKLAAGDAGILKLVEFYYAESGQPLKACELRPEPVACFLEAARLHAPDEGAYFEFANGLLQRQKFDQAIPILKDGLTRFNASAQLELALGVAFYGLRRFGEAAAAFQRTIALAPDLEQPYVFLGKMLDQVPASVPELRQTFAAFEKAHPDQATGYLLHAKALVLEGSGGAAPLLNKACQLNPQSAEAHYLLGLINERAGKFADAAGEFERAAALDGKDPVVHYHLARVYDRLGKADLALRERELHKRLLGTSATTPSASAESK